MLAAAVLGRQERDAPNKGQSITASFSVAEPPLFASATAPMTAEI